MTVTSKLWKPIDEFIKKLETGDMPAVHHYTSVRGALGILESGRIWFTERAHLNDPSEVSHGVEMAANILRGLDRKTDAGRLEACARNVFREFRFFSASFSREGDDLHQWRNYADDGRGVVLSFSHFAFNNPPIHIAKFIPGNPTVVACPMSYDSASLGSVITGIIKKWNGTDIEELCDHVLMISGIFKNDCWKFENEYRFFVHDHRQNILKSDHYKTREWNGKIVSYLDIPIQNWDSVADFPIFRIRLGPAACPHLCVQLRDFLYSKNIPIPPAGLLRSDLPYRTHYGT